MPLIKNVNSAFYRNINLTILISEARCNIYILPKKKKKQKNQLKHRMKNILCAEDRRKKNKPNENQQKEVIFRNKMCFLNDNVQIILNMPERIINKVIT